MFAAFYTYFKFSVRDSTTSPAAPSFTSDFYCVSPPQKKIRLDMPGCITGCTSELILVISQSTTVILLLLLLLPRYTSFVVGYATARDDIVIRYFLIPCITKFAHGEASTAYFDVFRGLFLLS